VWKEAIPMAMFPEDFTEDKKAREEYMEEYYKIAEEKELAEGDITVSETVDGRDPLPDLDDSEMLDDSTEDELTIVDEDDDLGFAELPDEDDDEDISDAIDNIDFRDDAILAEIRVNRGVATDDDDDDELDGIDILEIPDNPAASAVTFDNDDDIASEDTVEPTDTTMDNPRATGE